MTASRSVLVSAIVTVLAAAGLAAVATPSAATPPPIPAPSPSGFAAAATRSLVAAGLTPQHAAHRLAVQRANGARGAAVVARLGARAVGSYLDRDGNAVVTVLDAAAAAQATAAGVTPRIVTHSAAALATVKHTLDALPPVPDSSWGVDQASNQVTVTLSDATPPADAARVRAAVAGAGDLARMEPPQQGAFEPFFADGDAMYGNKGRCSAGFNVYSPSDDDYYTITAGHCTYNNTDWDIGPTVDSQFPNGADFGLTYNYYTDAQPVVDLYNGTTQPITGSGNPYVGEQFCKSGSTTAVTCGTVTELDRTVTYNGADTLYGMMVASTPSDHGDSGGGAFDGQNGIAMVSGGNGQHTVFFYQPIQPALDYYASAISY